MDEQAEKLFYEDAREKKAAAAGARGRRGRRGLVGKMVTPADILGKEYRKANDLGKFNTYELIQKLQQAPTLRDVLLERLDEEYKSYRQAIQRTIDAVAELLQMGLRAVEGELADVRARLTALEANLASAPARGAALAPAPASGRQRIKWGSSPDAVRATVFGQLEAIVDDPDRISTELIKQRIPSMLRWIYGEKAIFKGIDGLRQEFRAYVRAARGGGAGSDTGQAAEQAAGPMMGADSA